MSSETAKAGLRVVRNSLDWTWGNQVRRAALLVGGKGGGEGLCVWGGGGGGESAGCRVANLLAGCGRKPGWGEPRGGHLVDRGQARPIKGDLESGSFSFKIHQL